jgi:hypothetical protein
LFCKKQELIAKYLFYEFTYLFVGSMHIGYSFKSDFSQKKQNLLRISTKISPIINLILRVLVKNQSFSSPLVCPPFGCEAFGFLPNASQPEGLKPKGLQAKGWVKIPTVHERRPFPTIFDGTPGLPTKGRQARIKDPLLLSTIKVHFPHLGIPLSTVRVRV